MENIFMNFIYNKKMKKGFKRFINWLSYKIFLRDLKKISPDFGMLWQFADFVKMSEIATWYDNSKGNLVFSSKDYPNGENGFIINKEKDKFKLVFKLYNKDESISLEIHRDYGHRSNSGIKIKNRTLDFPSELNDILMINIIDILTDSMATILKEQYERGIR